MGKIDDATSRNRDPGSLAMHRNNHSDETIRGARYLLNFYTPSVCALLIDDRVPEHESTSTKKST